MRALARSFSSFFRKSTKPSSRQKQQYRERFAFRPRIEPLEQRQLMAVLSVANISVNEANGQAVFNVTRSDNASAATVEYRLLEGTAKAVSDYNHTPTVLSFAQNGATTASNCGFAGE